MTCRVDGCEEARYPRSAMCRTHKNEYRRAKYNGDPTGKDRALKFKYGITTAERDAMLVVQDGCAICHTWESGGRDWCVDHDHGCCPGKKTCGKCVRGILCFSCNVGLGGFKDNPELLARASDYLNVSRRLPA